jgi:hypothetical protein
MKKVILSVATALTLLSCEKEVNNANKSCGLIVDDNVEDYSITIRKSNGSYETIVLYPGDWVNAHVGSEICVNK